MSQKIQSTAESLDNKLLSAEKKMTDVGINERLGESQDPDDEGQLFQTMLSQTEQEAEETVRRHKEARQAADQKKSEVTQQLDKIRQMAHEGLNQLKTSEKRLSTDLNGHTDDQLEADIENKAEDLEQLVGSKAKLGESMMSRKARFAALAADGLAHPVAPKKREAKLGESMETQKARFAAMGADGLANVKLGESMTPLEQAEQAAEQAANDINADDSQYNDADDQQAAGDEPDNYDPADDQQAVDDGGVAADLSAIESDAKQLGAYQKNSINEINQIQEPLK